MSVSSVITGGFGAPGSASLVITDGYSTVGAVVVPSAPSSAPGGVRRARFLRRGPRLPGYDPEPEQPDVVVHERRKRIKAPVLRHDTPEDDPVPVAPKTVPSATRIHVPELGTAVLAEIDEEEEIVLMALLQ